MINFLFKCKINQGLVCQNVNALIWLFFMIFNNFYIFACWFFLFVYCDLNGDLSMMSQKMVPHIAFNIITSTVAVYTMRNTAHPCLCLILKHYRLKIAKALHFKPLILTECLFKHAVSPIDIYMSTVRRDAAFLNIPAFRRGTGSRSARLLVYDISREADLLAGICYLSTTPVVTVATFITKWVCGWTNIDRRPSEN